MKVIDPIPLTDGQLTSSTVPEDDYAEWDSSTTYAAEDFVIVIATHSVYRSVQGANLDNDPTTDDGTWWTRISATNRWKAFDRVIADAASKASGAIEYRIQPSGLVTGAALFGVEASQARIRVIETGTVDDWYDYFQYDPDLDATVLHDQTVSLVDDSAIIDWYSFFTEDLTDSELTQALFASFTCFPTQEIVITVGTGDDTNASVGEVAYGKVTELGTTLEGTEIGLTSFSTKEQDAFGNWQIVPRAKSDPVDFRFAMQHDDAGRVKRFLNRLRDKPAVYFADESLTSYDAVTFGLFQEYDIPLRGAGVSIVSLEIEGLT